MVMKVLSGTVALCIRRRSAHCFLQVLPRKTHALRSFGYAGKVLLRLPVVKGSHLGNSSEDCIDV